MVYFFGDWGMGDTKCTTCKHVSKLSPSAADNSKLTSTVAKTITGCASENRPIASRSASGRSVSSSSSSSSSSLTSLALSATSAPSNDLFGSKRSQHQLFPLNDQLHPQTLSLDHATALIRQRSSSIHDDRHKLCQQHSENDDEVAVHPLTNQVSVNCHFPRPYRSSASAEGN